MNTRLLQTRLSIRLASAAVAAASLSLPLLAGAAASDSDQALNRDAMAACKDGNRTQSRADCLNEARSVQRDAREGRAWTQDSSSMPMHAGPKKPAAMQGPMKMMQPPAQPAAPAPAASQPMR